MFLKTLREKMGKPEATDAEAVAFVETLKDPEAVLELTDSAFAEGEAKAKAEGATALAAKDAEHATALATVTDKAKADAATAATALADLQAKHERLMGGMQSPSGQTPERTAFAAFRQKVIDIVAESKCAEADASAKVQREFPDLFKAMIAEANPNQK